MPSGRSIARVALSALLIAAAGLGAYWFVRSRTAAAAAPPSQMTVSPTQNVQQTVQVVVPGATPLKPAAPPPALSPAASQPQGPASQPDPSDAHTTSTPTPVKIGDITFDVRTCRRAAQGVQCEFLVTNAGEETQLLVYTWNGTPDVSVAFDARGVTRTVVDARFAGQHAGGFGTQARLSPTVPTPLVVVFESTPAPTFDAVTLGVSIMRGYDREPSHAVVFRNVKIDG